jgi:hypothetical protein
VIGDIYHYITVIPVQCLRKIIIEVVLISKKCRNPPPLVFYHHQNHLVVVIVEHVLLHSCVVAYGVRCSITGGKRERDLLLFPPCRYACMVAVGYSHFWLAYFLIGIGSRPYFPYFKCTTSNNAPTDDDTK